MIRTSCGIGAKIHLQSLSLSLNWADHGAAVSARHAVRRMDVAFCASNAFVEFELMSVSTLGSGSIASDTVGSRIFWEATASFLRVAIWVIWIGVPVYCLVHFFLSQDPWPRIAMSSLLMAVGAISWVCLACHKFKAAIVIFGVGIWTGLVTLALLFGGVASTPMVLFPLMIMLAGWWCSTRAAWVTALVTIVATVGLMLASNTGLLPAHPEIAAPARAVTQCFAAILAAVLITYLVRSYRDRLAEVQQLSGDLAKHTAALQEVERDLNRAQAVARIGSWVYDLVANRMKLSDETCRIFGLPMGARGDYDSYVSRVIEADRESVRQAWRDALAGRTPFDHEHRIQLGDGERWVRQRAEFQLDEDGKPLLAVGTTQDITERKLADDARALLEAQLRESHKMEALGTLAGGIAHDFNNVLAAIMGNVELARQDVGRDHVAVESLDQIARAATRARALVQQILAFSRRQVLEKKISDLAPVVEDTVRMLRSTQPPGVIFETWCEPDTPPVMADATQIAQVLVNLCTNAWHAVEVRGRSGEIKVRLAPWVQSAGAEGTGEVFVLGRPGPGRHACLAVSDNGTGMDSQIQRRIFEPFFTTKTTAQGTGLGLAVVHGIVHAHEGSIALDSAPGAGTTIRIYFPEAERRAVTASPCGIADTVAPAIPPASHPMQQGKGRHVLVVDDDEALVILITPPASTAGLSRQRVW